MKKFLYGLMASFMIFALISCDPAASVPTTYEVDSFDAFKSAISKDNVIVVLSENINSDDTETMEIGTNVTIDLNSKQLNLKTGDMIIDGKPKPVNAFSIVDGGTLKIMNGTLDIKHTDTATETTAISVKKDSKLILDQVSYTTNMCPALPRDNAIIKVINQSSIKSTSNYGISTNNTYGTPPQIEIQDSTIEVTRTDKDTSALLMNGGGNISIKNSTIKAQRHCVIVRGGSATLENVQLIKTDDYSNDRYDGDYGSGNEVAEAVIFIGSNKSTEYMYNSTVTVKGNTTIEVPTGYSGEKVHVSGRETYAATMTTQDDALKNVPCKVYIHSKGSVTVNGKSITSTSEVTL